MEIGTLHPVAYAQPPTRQNNNGGTNTAHDTEQPTVTRSAASSGNQQLSQEELKQVQELKARDREVRAHERAHAAAAGSLARGGPSYTTQRGPDGRWYAVGGEVQIDTSAVPGDPHATLQKALKVQRAAMAPASPSAQDRAVAASAAAMAAQARMEIAREGLQAQEEAIGGTRESQPSEKAAAEARDAQCPVCGSPHGASAHNEALAQHFANSVTPREASGTLVSSVV